jgi:cbb3-type cytochrome oxidase subunit 1
MLVEKNYYGIWPHPDLVSAHTHLILLGSVMMMIMGVALWFFPRPEKEDSLYKPELILACYYIMTVSTAVRFAAQVISSVIIPNEALKLVLLLSALGQLVGLIIFFISMWGRIRSVGSHIRESKGEKF